MGLLVQWRLAFFYNQGACSVILLFYELQCVITIDQLWRANLSNSLRTGKYTKKKKRKIILLHIKTNHHVPFFLFICA